MSYSDTLAKLRKDSGLTQAAAARYISLHSAGVRTYTFKNISHWETGVSLPPIEQFLLLCELYDVRDIQKTFRDALPSFRPQPSLNPLGKSRIREYLSMLYANPLFLEADPDAVATSQRPGVIKLYDIPAAAGYGSFLDSDYYEDLDIDDTVPPTADYAVKISGDSMTPRFVDSQIVFVREQQVLDIGDIGIFGLDGDAYIKKLGQGELLSLNPLYKPIVIHSYSSFHIFGKVLS